MTSMATSTDFGGTGNLVTSDTTFNVVISGNWSSADTTTVSITTGYTTDATHGINISTMGNARHHGVWSTNHYRIDKSSLTYSSAMLISGINNIKVDGLQLKQCNTGNYYILRADTNATNLIFSNNIFSGTANVYNPYAIGFQAPYGVIFYNNIIFGTATQKGVVFRYVQSISQVSNNTVYGLNSGMEILDGGTAPILKNNIAYKNLTDYIGTYNATSTNNLSKDATSPNTAFRNATLSFADTLNGDFNLISTDTSAIGNAISLEATFTTDITGATRTVPWDIGAFKYIAQVVTSFGSVLNDSVWNDTVFK